MHRRLFPGVGGVDIGVETNKNLDVRQTAFDARVVEMRHAVPSLFVDHPRVEGLRQKGRQLRRGKRRQFHGHDLKRFTAAAVWVAAHVHRVRDCLGKLD